MTRDAALTGKRGRLRADNALGIPDLPDHRPVFQSEMSGIRQHAHPSLQLLPFGETDDDWSAILCAEIAQR
ncbi:hypothetical protein [Sagittula sp. NFXS13]|uniref:hypothetical protein n=1 Tax=Sagittula sp. NFXS13 TaxID=2819095 RepID=UPI0032E04DA7